MLQPRIIPCLLVRNKGLVKTVKFGDGKYVGDPLNAVRIYNEKMVDELIVLDIDATVENREPDFKMIANLAAECRMPLCYGGGIKTVEQAQRIFESGVEKIALSSAAHNNHSFITEVVGKVGSQSVVIVIDAKKRWLGNRYDVWTHNATINTKRSPGEFAAEMAELGVGEIVINSIDNDGAMGGYDIPLIREIFDQTQTPVTAIGGAGSHTDIQNLIKQFGIIGSAAGSLFVFKGKYRAVLINYPRPYEKDELILESMGAGT